VVSINRLKLYIYFVEKQKLQIHIINCFGFKLTFNVDSEYGYLADY